MAQQPTSTGERGGGRRRWPLVVGIVIGVVVLILVILTALTFM